MEIVVTPQLQINSTTGEWEVSYNEGQTWQPLGVAATGAGGMDGITPQLSIGADMCWQVSYDNGNTWTSLNVKAQGMDGANGINGADGRDGVNGTNGTDGRDGTDGKNGRDGVNGTNGMDGKNGANGLTPHIRENGNWYIGDTDTGVAAAGKDGKNGKDGMNGRDGINGVDGKDGKDGADGKDGVGVSAVAIDAEGSLLVTFTDENMVNVGTIPTNDQKLDEVKTLSTTSAATTGTSLAAVIAFAMYLFFKRNK